MEFDLHPRRLAGTVTFFFLHVPKAGLKRRYREFRLLHWPDSEGGFHNPSEWSGWFPSADKMRTSDEILAVAVVHE